MSSITSFATRDLRVGARGLFRTMLAAAAPLLLVVVLMGCGSSARTAVEGYTDAMIDGRPVAIVIPEGADMALANPSDYAWSRGVAASGANGMFHDEIRRLLAPALDERLDSNSVVLYSDVPASAAAPVMEVDVQKPVNWSALQSAARVAKVEFIIAIPSMHVDNMRPSGPGRGTEHVSLEYRLLDPTRSRVMASGQIDFEVGDPRVPADTYDELARRLSSRLPFRVVGGTD